MYTELATRVNPGGIHLASDGSAYLAPGTPLNPCESCVVLARRLTSRDDQFAPGRELELAAAPDTQTVARRPGWWARMRGKRG